MFKAQVSATEHGRLWYTDKLAWNIKSYPFNNLWGFKEDENETNKNDILDLWHKEVL